MKTLYAWACFVVRYSGCSCIPTRNGTDEVKNFQLGWAMFAILLLFKTHDISSQA